MRVITFSRVFPSYHPRKGNQPRVITTGEKYSYLTFAYEVDSKFQSNGNRKRYGLFKCDCGVDKKLLIYSVTSGHIKSCGCYGASQRSKSTIARNTTHGLSKHDLFKRWQKIKGRCLRATDKRCKDYGGRGITICEEWRTDFMSFYNWANNNGYSPDLEIDRRDNNSGYSPDNCHFVTTKANANNTRRNIFVEFNNQRMTLQQACESANVLDHYRMIWQRVKEGKSFQESIQQYLCQKS